MAKASHIITNFTAGELSPLLDGRVDIARYYNGAKTLENFITLPYGGTTRRPGTYYVATTKDSTKKSRLIPFQFSTDQAYMIELGDRYARFFANRGQILSSGSVYEITTPWLEADLPELQFAQDADTMFLTHSSYKPRELSRTVTFDSYTKLSLPCNGTDGSTTFTDSATSKVVTAVGTAQIDTAQYKFNGSSGLFDGNSDYLTLVDSNDWNFGTGNLTIDHWVRFNDITNSQYFFVQWEDADNRCGFHKDVSAEGNKIKFYWTIGGVIKASYEMANAWAGCANDTWYHIAIVRSGTSFYLFIDGVSQTLTVNQAVGTNDLGNIASLLYIGANWTGSASGYLNGWLAEVRISKGIARWTANFTPPTTTYTADQPVFTVKNYAPELMTLDVAPGGAGWAAGDTITGNTSGKTCIIVEVLTTTTYRVRNRDGTFTLGEVLTNGTVTADQGAANPTFTGDPFGADGSDDCPLSVSINEQRLHFANTNNNPQKNWASVSGDYQDMTTGTGDADAFIYTIGSEQVNAIRWLSSGRFLSMGTLGGVFSLSSGASGTPITPTNVVVKKETSYGALAIMPKKIGNMTYYVQRNGRTIREFGYRYDVNENLIQEAFDTMLLAEHIPGSGIVEMDYQQSPYNLLWCVRSDGEMAVLTRQVEEEVLSWTRIVTNGDFESVAVIPGDGGDDEVWVIVKRYIDSSYVRYVEYFKPFDFGTEQEDSFFVDCGLTLDLPKPITAITKANPGVVTATNHGFSNGDIVIIRGVVGMTEVNKQKYKVAGVSGDTFQLTNPSDSSNVNTASYTTYSSGGEVRKCVASVTGLSHLEKEAVSVCVDGVEGVAGNVSGGAITITTPANGGGEIHAGLVYTSTLKTVRIEAGSQMGTAQSKLKRIAKAYAMINESFGMKMGNDSQMDDVIFDDNELYSGWKDITFPSLWDRDGYIIITQDKPLPLTILSIVLYMTTSDV